MKKKRAARKRPSTPTRTVAFVAPERPPHALAVTRPVPGSDIPMELAFVLTRDEIYTAVSIRKPPGPGPFPAIVMARGNGRGGFLHVETQVERLASMQDRMIARGYAVVYPNYRNEIPHLYEREEAVANLPDDVSGGDKRTLKSAPSLDSDDFIAVIRYLEAQPWVKRGAIGAVGVSHGGELILKTVAQIPLGAGVVIEGASHEFLSVNTGPSAPRNKDQIQYQDIAVVKKNADKKRAMRRVRGIRAPILHIGRDRDHLQGIFKLAHEWMQEAGKDSTWTSFDHPDHGFPFIYRQADGSWRPDAVQQKAFDLFMRFFDERLKRAEGRKRGPDDPPGI